MAWGARQEDDGAWRICERRGGTVVHLFGTGVPDVEVKFPGRAKAEQCAHALNEAHWPAYEQARKKKTKMTDDDVWSMVQIIENNQGITPEDMEKINGYYRGSARHRDNGSGSRGSSNY